MQETTRNKIKSEQENPIKIAICDDNSDERKFLHDMCKSIKEQKVLQIMVKQYEDGNSLLFDFEDTRIMVSVDIVLLDINMPGENGIQVAQKIRELGYQGEIIFVTNSNEHWRDAFGIRAFNYITKDEDLKVRFFKIFLDAVEKSRERQGQVLILSSLSETRQVPVANISHFVVDKYLVTVFYDNEKFGFLSSLVKVEALLFDNERFIRIHRSTLVSVSHIQSFDGKSVTMRNGDKLAVSRYNVAGLKAAMQKISLHS